MSLVTGLIKDYGDFKIHIPQWEIPDQGITALIGPSGAGKTSIFRLLIGLESCPTLSWTLKGVDIAKQDIPSKRLGVVFQNYELFPHMSARENLEFAAHARKIKASRKKENLEKLTQLLKIQYLLERPTAVLSGGEKQRVALARALIGEPQFLFLDEPFSAIDEDLKNEARALVKKTVEEFKIPTLLITHDPRDVESLASSTVQVNMGQLKNS
ncbi:MAG: ATP-binding cassette domain-containing protein [Bdellovibrionales bacterium]